MAQINITPNTNLLHDLFIKDSKDAAMAKSTGTAFSIATTPLILLPTSLSRSVYSLTDSVRFGLSVHKFRPLLCILYIVTSFATPPMLIFSSFFPATGFRFRSSPSMASTHQLIFLSSASAHERISSPDRKGYNCYRVWMQRSGRHSADNSEARHDQKNKRKHEGQAHYLCSGTPYIRPKRRWNFGMPIR